ncbi:MAG: glycosyltransferase family 4 protein [Gilvibacter sp.]
MRKSLLYIGNDLRRDTSNPTYMAGLSVALRDAGYFVKTASSKSNKILRLWDMCSTVYKLRRKVDFVLIDTYSTQNFYYAYCVGVLCRWFKIAYIPILHGGNLPKRLNTSPRMSKQLFGKAYQNISPSEYLMAAFHTAGFTNVNCIPNAIEIAAFPFTSRESLNPLKILWMRSFKDIYNPLLALETLRLLVKNHPEVTMTMAGPVGDDSLELCKKYAEVHKLPVTFMGKLTRIEWAKLASDYNLFLNTSRFDNMPLSFLEAMALGLPIVSTNVGGIPYFVHDEQDAILVHAQEPEAVSTAIINLANSIGLAARISQNGRVKALAHDWLPIMEQWEAVLG